MHTTFKNKRITVMGLGIFGGGIGVTQFLVKEGAHVTVTDVKSGTDLFQSLRYIEGLPLTYHLGGHREEDFIDMDMVIVNPAVPGDSKYLQIARENGIPIDTEINIFFKLCPASTIGITGSNGKSTTTTLIGKILQQTSKKVWVGGNIGRSLLLQLEEMRPSDIVVLELSSFQLEALSSIKRSPGISVVTNISPNHLDRHKDIGSYVLAKKHIILHQKHSDYAILNYDDPKLRTWETKCNSRILWYSTKHSVENGAYLKNGHIVISVNGNTVSIPCVSEIKLPGDHNLHNILAASCAAYLNGANKQNIEETVTSFPGLEHRLEFVREVKGIKYYNDSKATTPESAIAAVTSFKDLVLIAGGYDKGSDFGEFAEVCANHCKAVILIGKTANTIKELISRKRRSKEQPHVFIANTLNDAFQKANTQAMPGGVLLLSPACASYDMFNNYEERGKQFKDMVFSL
ncbi:MAG: UDP-N-acetylmuramoyl-L-alanine--D-glutamate ligase [Candidatus Kuenenia sp.]|nr:UDP-N-acetylmuramoyl-L-alanine--D-glutamate ligase [Candidatus Kuenenia hertensis]